VSRKLKFLVVFAMLVLVPLRALAAVTVGLCATGEGGTVNELVAHHHGAGSDNTSPDHDNNDSQLLCSLCTSCCTGASFAATAPRTVPLASTDFERTPFFGRDPGAHIPGQLDRPPLSL
jgi:hypothetical protein